MAASRAMYGIFGVYKPRGVNSSAIVLEVKKFVGKSIKVGHGGTLDPLAEGVLVLGLGRSCKLLHKPFLHESKTYKAVGQLGFATESMDLAGKVVHEKPFEHVEINHLIACLNNFRGKITQTPPM